MAALYKINYKSDFVLTINSDAGWAVPFCIKFWTGMPLHGYFAGFDGENYVNCRVGETPTQLLVMFDDHHMPIGELKMQIAYHTTIEEFPDRKFDEVTNPTNVTVEIDGTEYQVMLDFTGETGAEIDFSMPSSGVMSVNGKIGYVTLNAEDVGAQPTIEDLSTIRSGAAAGATAVQPAAMNSALATKQDTISDLATIRSGAAAGATAYQKPGTGIPKTDLASGVQSSLDKADAAAPKSNTYTKSEVNELVEEAVSHQTMIVTISSDGNYTADKTFAEIKAFLDSGGTVIAKDEEDGDSYYYLDNYIASEVVFTRNIWGSGGFSTRYYTIDNTNTVSFIDSVHHISSAVDSSSTANLANSAAVKTVNDKVATKQDTISDLATIRSGAAAGATAVQPAALQEGLAGKQDTISDLATIRSGAAAGATAVQPAALTPIENDIDAIEGKIPSAASASNQLADKAFVNSALSSKADAADIPTALSQLSQDSTHRVVTDTEKATWNGKQNAIDDLATIRSGAAAGATAVQPATLQEGLAGKQDTISDLATIRSGAAAGATAVQPAAMNTALAEKQDTLTFDNAPTANSNNPVKSSGIKTALDEKQSTISTVNVTVDNNTGTPSGSASVSGSTLSLSFQNLKGGTGATGATGPQGPRGERGLPGESGVTGDVSGFTVIQTIDPSATYGATDIAGAATVQATNQELTELGGFFKNGVLSECYYIGAGVPVKNVVDGSELVNKNTTYQASNVRIVLDKPYLVAVTPSELFAIELSVPYSAISDPNIDRVTICFYDDSKTWIRSTDLGWTYFNGSTVEIHVDMSLDTYQNVRYAGFVFGSASASISPSSIDASLIDFSLIPFGEHEIKALNKEEFQNYADETDKAITQLDSEIYREDGATGELTQADATDNNYKTATSSGSVRGAYLLDVSEYNDFTLSVTLQTGYALAMHGWADDTLESKVYDSGWLTAGTPFSLTKTMLPSAKYVVFWFTNVSGGSAGSGDPGFSKFIQYVIWDLSIVYGGGILSRLNDLEMSINGGEIPYVGEKIILKSYGYNCLPLGTLQNGTSSRQGGATYGNYLFQFHNTLATICVYDLQNASNVDKLTLTAMSNCHAGSGGFSSTFYNASDPFPLLYISSMNEKKIYVYRTTGEVGSLSISLIQTITLDTEYYLPNIAIDVENSKIVIFGYTQNSWASPTNNNSVVFTCDIPSYGTDVTISSFSEAYVMPFIYAEQGAFAKDGILYLSYGNTSHSYGGGLYVIDYNDKRVKSFVDFSTIGTFEPEACCMWDEKIVVTSATGVVYLLTF